MNPDIIFADVLLQKRDGYEVCSDVKADAQLAKIPVVLIWSGFMEVDEDKVQACGADAHLEKPFDSKQLREVIENLVPKTKEQNLKDYLNFPSIPPVGADSSSDKAETLSPDLVQTNTQAPPLPNVAAQNSDEDFQEVSLPQTPPSFDPSENTSSALFSDQDLISETDDTSDGQWVRKSLSNYDLNLEQADTATTAPQVDYDVPDEEIKSDSLVFQKDIEEPSTPYPQPPSVETPGEEYDPNEASVIINMADLGSLDEEATKLTEVTQRFKINTKPPAVGATMPEPPAPEATIAEPATPHLAPAKSIPQLSEEQLEDLIRAQSKEVIESVVWKVVPELAEQMIKRELESLLKSIEH